jgi:mRNA-degrading endonuclease HigB of HigAB toxin-antitoxin module
MNSRNGDELLTAARWRSLQEVRSISKNADDGDDCVIFKIRHNRYRLITVVHYVKTIEGNETKGQVHVRSFLTHKELPLCRSLLLLKWKPSNCCPCLRNAMRMSIDPSQKLIQFPWCGISSKRETSGSRVLFQSSVQRARSVCFSPGNRVSPSIRCKNSVPASN